MIKSIKQSIRSRRLRMINRGQLRRSLDRTLQGDACPIFFIFTRELVHFTPFCLPGERAEFEPVMILNGCDPGDADWMSRTAPGVPLVNLTTSLTGNPDSLLSHGEVLEDLFAVCQRPFCIQDPDCFVRNDGFWDRVAIQPSEYAAGPFTKRPTDHDHVLPDTFFVMFNTPVYQAVARKYRLTANATADLSPAATNALRRVGYQPGQYPEQFKGYFDTLQTFWLAAMAEGYTFGEIPGTDDDLIHIGGTSYLHRSDSDDLSHWDYWPLSVRYFNLRLLDRPHLERFRSRFETLFRQHRSADDLLDEFPGFVGSRRHVAMDHLLSGFDR